MLRMESHLWLLLQLKPRNETRTLFMTLRISLGSRIVIFNKDVGVRLTCLNSREAKR